MKKTLPPDEFDLKTGSTTILKSCPFCGNYPITTCCYNAATEIYGCEVICYCGASLVYTADTRENARMGAIKNWSKRV